MQIFLRAAKISRQNPHVNPSNLRIRRATVEDLAALKAIWLSMRLPADELESRLTEFQVVEADGEVAGAIGFQIIRTAALLHNEGYVDFAIADTARELLWERIESLTANHGVFRLWTQENSPFWQRWGFQPANGETLSRLPDEWKTANGKWFTLELKNEDAVNAALKNQFATFMDAEKKQAADISARARKISVFLTVILFLVGAIGFGLAIYLFMHFKSATR